MRLSHKSSRGLQARYPQSMVEVGSSLSLVDSPTKSNKDLMLTIPESNQRSGPRRNAESVLSL